MACRPRANRREQTPHPTRIATDAEIAAMTPDQRALHDAEVSLQRQKHDMELRHEAETQSLYMSVEEDMVNRFRALIRESSRPPARSPTAREEATTAPRLHSKPQPLFSGHGGPRGCRYRSSTPINLLRLVWKRGPREGSALTREAPTLRPRGRALQTEELQSRGGY